MDAFRQCGNRGILGKLLVGALFGGQVGAFVIVGSCLLTVEPYSGEQDESDRKRIAVGGNMRLLCAC